MPTTLQTVDLDAAFASLDPGKVIIINDLPNRTEEDQERFNWLIKEVYTSDMITMLPKCRCGTTKGEHRVGLLCGSCGEPVRQSIEEDIRPILWFRKPEGIKRLITPHTLIMLQDRFKKRNFDVIQYLMDPKYTVQGVKPESMRQVMADGLPRGYNNFVEHFYTIIDYLSKSPLFKNQKSTDRFIRGMLGVENMDDDILVQMLKDNKDTIFCDYLPLPNRALLVVEQSFSKNYVESHALGIHNALNTMRSIDRDYHDQKLSTKESRTARILLMMTDYMRDYVETNIRPKGALPRKHIYGSRGNYTFRAVITSHEKLAAHDEIHAPWSASIATFWQHVMSVLMARRHPLGGMCHTQATCFLMDHIEKYDPRLDAIFQSMISETRHQAILTLLQRNPSLLKGSAQLVRLTKVKTDPKDTSVSMSDLICTALNADYDGDFTNFTPALDHYMEDMYYPFSPFFNLLQLSKPLELSNVAAMTESVIASTSEWISREKRML